MEGPISEHAERSDSTPPVDRLSRLWQRVHDHKIAQWTVAYAALSYGVQHAIILTSESFGWPGAVARVSMLLLVLGLPLVVTFAWYHGARASRNFSQAELSILSALLVASSLLFYAFVQPAQNASPAVQQASVSVMRSAAVSPKGAISLAVLPFLNLSSDKEQEFFSDGMTEEITTALAKVPDLRVVGRTSAFQFKGANKDLRSIGQALSATHLIEGSVRKAGNRVRITAQLIKADDGTHIWAEDYDRDLTDVFAIQEDIARAITSSLHMTLGLKPGENLVNNRNIDPESHQQYLRALALIRNRGRQSATQATALLEQLVSVHPDYAPAWSLLAGAYYFMNNTSPELASGPVEAAHRIIDTNLSKMEAASRKSIELDPNEPDGHFALGILLWERGKTLEGDELIAKAFGMDPNNPEVLNGRMITLAIEGRLKEAVSVGRQLQIVEPYIPALNQNTANVFWAAGETDAAIALLNALPGNRPGRAAQLAKMYAGLGRYREAADLLDGKSPLDPTATQKEAARLLRLAPNAPDAQTSPTLIDLDWVYLHVGAPERALEDYERQAAVGHFNAGRVSRIWHPSYALARKTERFKNIVRHLGLPEFWRARGWPDLCHPTTGDDFECS